MLGNGHRNSGVALLSPPSPSASPVLRAPGWSVVLAAPAPTEGEAGSAETRTSLGGIPCPPPSAGRTRTAGLPLPAIVSGFERIYTQEKTLKGKERQGREAGDKEHERVSPGPGLLVLPLARAKQISTAEAEGARGATSRDDGRPSGRTPRFLLSQPPLSPQLTLKDPPPSFPLQAALVWPLPGLYPPPHPSHPPSTSQRIP